MAHKAVPGKSRAFHPSVSDHTQSVNEAIASHLAVVEELRAGNIVPAAPAIIADIETTADSHRQVVVLQYDFVHGVPAKDVKPT